MRDEISIRQWIENFDEGLYKAEGTDTQIRAGWYNWFCEDRLLPGKTRKLGRLVKQVSVSPLVDLDNWYVWFKNNCPMNGKLYDDFRFAHLATGEVKFSIVPKEGCTATYGQSALWGRKGNSEFGQLVAGTWDDVLAYLKVPAKKARAK